MAVPFSNTKLRVPAGFQSCLEGLAKEVLRKQPSDIYAFAYAHFESLLKRREETGEDCVQDGAQKQDRFYNNKTLTNPDIDPSNSEHHEAALKIQTKYRQHNAKKVYTSKKQEHAAVKIQAGFRGYQDRQTVNEMRQQSENERTETPQSQDDLAQVAENDESTNQNTDKPGAETLEKPEDQTDAAETVTVDQSQGETEVVQDETVDEKSSDELDAAAVKIQAAARGYVARKQVQSIKDQDNSHENEESNNAPVDIETEQVPNDYSETEMNAAATKIQATFKGHATRKQQRDNLQNNNSTLTEDLEPTAPPINEEAENEADTEADNKADNADDATMNAAATKIQSSYKGHLTRKQMSDKQKTAMSSEPEPSTQEPDPDLELAATKIQATYKGHRTRKEMQSSQKDSKQEQDPVAIETSAPDPDVVTEQSSGASDADKEAAAVKIQAGMKGMKARRDVAALRSERESANQQQDSAEVKDTEPVDIDLDDPEVAAAATKIQAGFRGYTARKSAEQDRKDGTEAEDEKPGSQQGDNTETPPE